MSSSKFIGPLLNVFPELDIVPFDAIENLWAPPSFILKVSPKYIIVSDPEDKAVFETSTSLPEVKEINVLALPLVSVPK